MTIFFLRLRAEAGAMIEHRIIYCLHVDCGVAQPPSSRNLQFCPACKRESRWTPDQLRHFVADKPRWELNAGDLKFLHSHKISPE